jgi:hypothetical protein
LRLRATVAAATRRSKTLDTGLLPRRPLRCTLPPVAQSLLLDDESDEPHPELESSLEEPESQPLESSLSSSEESLLHASSAAPHPSATAGAASVPDEEPELVEGEEAAGGADVGGALGGTLGATGPHAVASAPAVTTGLDGCVAWTESGTSLALLGVTSPSTRVTHTSLAASPATANAASSDVPPQKSAPTVAPASSCAHGPGPGTTPSAPAGHEATKGTASFFVV